MVSCSRSRAGVAFSFPGQQLTLTSPLAEAQPISFGAALERFLLRCFGYGGDCAEASGSCKPSQAKRASSATGNDKLELLELLEASSGGLEGAPADSLKIAILILQEG